MVATQYRKIDTSIGGRGVPQGARPPQRNEAASPSMANTGVLSGSGFLQIAAQDAPWRAKLYRELQYRLPGRFYSRLAVEKNSLALRYFGILGPDGRYAVPGLVNLYARSAPGSPARENVLAALAELGPQAVAAVPVLASAVAAKTNSEGRVLAILALSRMGTNAAPAGAVTNSQAAAANAAAALADLVSLLGSFGVKL